MWRADRVQEHLAVSFKDQRLEDVLGPEAALDNAEMNEAIRLTLI